MVIKKHYKIGYEKDMKTENWRQIIANLIFELWCHDMVMQKNLSSQRESSSFIPQGWFTQAIALPSSGSWCGLQ